MKNITKLFAAMAVCLAFASCEKLGGTDQELPLIKKVAINEEGDNFAGTFKVTCAETEALKEVAATYTLGTKKIAITGDDLVISKIKNTEWTVEVKCPVKDESDVRVSAINIKATLKGANGGEVEESFTISNNTPSPSDELNEPLAFSFKRSGTTVTGDLSTFGLEWKQNNTRAAFAYITKGAATKMVTLAANAYTTISTESELKAAVDAGTDMTTFKGISADATKDYNTTLGVINGGVYYMINIAKATVKSETAGTTIEVTGTYRK